jgi:hypothetical protein
MDTKQFIEKAIRAHNNNTYDYSETEFISWDKKVLIKCPIHGVFYQSPKIHLRGHNCPKCAGNVKSNTQEFIEEAKKIHENKYDYSKVNYIRRWDKITIICPQHGEFIQAPKSHLDGQGCPKCNGGVKSNTQEFIEKAKIIHNDKYDYSKVIYPNNAYEKVTIICKKHGEFEQSAGNHLAGQGCPKCNGGVKSNTQEFIEKVKEVHGNKYDYSKVNYIDSRIKIMITCKKHGDFEQMPINHLRGKGCPHCAGNIKLTNQEFMDKANIEHDYKYSYEKLNYTNAQKNVTITCPIHGDFSQRAKAHLTGQGCPTCKESRLEKHTRMFLKKYNIDFIPQKRFDDCKDKNTLPFDFYLPALNTCIECQGDQHYFPNRLFGGEEAYQALLIRDQIKRDYCIQKGINLIEIKYDQIPKDVLSTLINR